MKTRSPRRAAALLLALALACSLLTLPAAAEDVITLSRSSLDLEVGQTETISVVGAPTDATINWQSMAPSVATVKPDTGPTTEVTGVSKSSSPITILAMVNGIPYPCSVTVTGKKVAVTGITLNTNYLEMLTGDNGTLTATVQPSDATNKNVTWKSSDTSVVTVNNSRGYLTAVGPGQAYITATTEDGGYPATCLVVVNQRPAISSVTLDQPYINLSIEGTATLTATVEGSAASEGVTWTTSRDDRPADNPVTVRSTGQVTVDSNTARYTLQIKARSSASLGDQVTITATAKADATMYALCPVTIIAPPTPKVSAVTITSPNTDSYRYVDPGSTVTLAATALPAEASEDDRRITWSSDQAGVAKVDQYTGVVTGVAPGEATITATAGVTDPKTDTRVIETSGILLSYTERPDSGGAGTTVSLTEDSVVPIYQYRDISASCKAFGNAKNKNITWDSSNNTVAQALNGRVTANYPGEATITASVDGTGFIARFKVKVSEDVADAVTVSMGSSPSYSFSNFMSQLNSRSQSKAGGPLESVSSLKVSTENGVLYYGYTSPESPGHGVGGTERYYYQPIDQGQMALRDVTFVPLPGFDGTAVVEYNATATNGTTFNGTIRIEATASGDVAYSTVVDQPVTFAAEHFSAVCKSRNGQAIRYVTFAQPAASRGTLHYNYSPTGQYSPKVNSSTLYYASSNPSIDGITFVPAEGFAGTVDIAYRCTDSSGASYTGTVTVTVYSPNGSTTGDVEYSTGRNQRQDFRASDFNDACKRAVGGTLDYVRFNDLPGSSSGILYLDYTGSSSTKVSTGRDYYRNSSPRISDISFVPARDYSGTVTIPFTAANTSGDTFSGELVIHVDDGVGTVHYNTPRNQAVTFDAADFNDASRQINGTSLNYVRFTSLPSSSAGILYSNYVSASSPGSRVTTGTNYRRSGSPSLSSVTFVPASGYNGTVTIPFTAYDDNGSTFDGSVTIAVGSASGTVSYSTVTNGSVRFDGADFNSACRSATGDPLSYVRFDLPASRYGTLYHQYNRSSRIGNSVASSTNYYYSGSGSRLISDVSFAASTTTGTVTFDYTGYSTGGDSFSGIVEIRVSNSGTGSTSIRYTGSSTPITFRSSDFQNACQTALGNPLSYVQFSTLPAVGHLNQNYAGPAQTGTGVNSVTHYGTQELDQISYLPKAEYQGTILIPYTLYDTQGGSHSGSVEIQLSNAYCYSSFSDTASGWDWAKPSIEFLRYGGITNGYSDNTYRPGRSISRGEFTLMICRAFQFPTTGSSGFPDVPANSAYAGAVGSARSLGIVQGNNGLFQPNRPITRQSAMTMICRAMEAAGQAVPAANTSLLSSYADGGQVSAYARSSVAALVQMGAVRGNSAMRLNPASAISRAEMAVILHRVLTR